jgi:hypothetical protein
MFITNMAMVCNINGFLWITIRFGVTLSNLTHNETDTTLHGNGFLKNLIDRVQIETKKKSPTNRTINLPTNGKNFLFVFLIKNFFLSR